MKQKIIFYKYRYAGLDYENNEWEKEFEFIDSNVANKDFLKQLLKYYAEAKITKPNLKLMENCLSENKKQISLIMENNSLLSEKIKKIKKKLICN